MPKTCLAKVQEIGFIPRVGSKTGVGPHLSYNGDGYMIKAAGCYINERYKATGGQASAARDVAPAPKAVTPIPKLLGSMADHSHGHGK